METIRSLKHQFELVVRDTKSQKTYLIFKFYVVEFIGLISYL
jgi:hypothetical protein